MKNLILVTALVLISPTFAGTANLSAKGVTCQYGKIFAGANGKVPAREVAQSKQLTIKK